MPVGEVEAALAGRYLDAAAALLELPIRPEDRAEVLAAFLVLAAQARLVTGFALPKDQQVAPRFMA